MVALFPASIVLAFASAAAPNAVVGIESIGLTDDETASLRSTVQQSAAAQGVQPVIVDNLPTDCTKTPACVESTLAAHDARVLLHVQALQVAGSLQLTEAVASNDGVLTESVREDLAGVTGLQLAPTTTAALATFSAPTKTATTTTTTTTAAEGDGRLGLGLALRADIAMQHGRTFGVTVAEPSLNNTLSGDGIKGFGGGVLLQLSWHLPIDGHWLNRAFGVEFDVGYSLTGENGTVPFTQYETKDGTTSLVTTNYDYAGLIHMVPMSLGLRSRLPLQDLQLPVHVDVAVGGNAVWGLSVATATVQGEAVNFATDNSASDFAFGFYAEGGVALDLGPGELVGAYRYVSTYLDFEHPAENPGPGDLGGHHLLVGYRFTL